MNKLKNIFLLLVLGVITLVSCDEQIQGFVNPYEDVDYEALAISDNDSILKFLNTHYYDSALDDVKLINSGQASMFSNTISLKMTEVTQNDIKYKLYAYITEEGKPNPVKGSPTEMDSIFVNRKGVLLFNNSIENDPFDQADQTWWSLISTFGIVNSAPSPIIGWVKGFPFFKSGENITNNGPITYQNTGKGYIFIPSGLAYPSINYVPGQATNSLFDQIIVFKVELLDFVEDTDHDNDGVPTIKEDADGDGNPVNDFSDSTNPNLPDYLNPNIR